MILQDIINRIDTYYKDIPIHTNEIKQGLKLPCFFVHPISASIEREYQGRFWYRANIQVTYIPSDNEDALIRDKLGDKLIIMLESIPTEDGRILSKNLDIKQIDGCITIDLDYAIYLKQVEDKEEFMRVLKNTFRTVRR